MKILSILLIALSLSACEQSTKTKDGKEVRSITIDVPSYSYPDLKVIEVDGCEYLFGAWGNATVMAHKGNCKYCLGANKELEKAPKPAIVKP